MPSQISGVVPGAIPSGVPHLAIPFLITGIGSAQVVQQDSLTEIVQCVAMLCGTRPGTRLMIPTYGLVDPTFAGVDVVKLQLASARWEERASVGVEVNVDNVEVVVVEVAGGTTQ